MYTGPATGAPDFKDRGAQPDTDQHRAPLYDTCEHCQLPVRPGESHGVVQSDAKGEPQLVCKIQRLEMVEQIVPAVPASIAGRG